MKVAFIVIVFHHPPIRQLNCKEIFQFWQIPPKISPHFFAMYFSWKYLKSSFPPISNKTLTFQRSTLPSGRLDKLLKAGRIVLSTTNLMSLGFRSRWIIDLTPVTTICVAQQAFL